MLSSSAFVEAVLPGKLLSLKLSWRLQVFTTQICEFFKAFLGIVTICLWLRRRYFVRPSVNSKNWMNFRTSFSFGFSFGKWICKPSYFRLSTGKFVEWETYNEWIQSRIFWLPISVFCLICLVFVEKILIYRFFSSDQMKYFFIRRTVGSHSVTRLFLQRI
jgi:hypothetical protein